MHAPPLAGRAAGLRVTARCALEPAPDLVRSFPPAPGHSQGPLRAPCARRRGCGLMASRFLLVLAYELK